MLDRTYQNLEMSFFCLGKHASVLQIIFDVIPLDAFHVPGFRIPDSDSISDFEEIYLWQDDQRLQ